MTGRHDGSGLSPLTLLLYMLDKDSLLALLPSIYGLSFEGVGSYCTTRSGRRLFFLRKVYTRLGAAVIFCMAGKLLYFSGSYTGNGGTGEDLGGGGPNDA
jgi:VIT1/CCC1 family predicted Fe2+/Mn2+ transporter